MLQHVQCPACGFLPALSLWAGARYLADSVLCCIGSCKGTDKHRLQMRPVLRLVPAWDCRLTTIGVLRGARFCFLRQRPRMCSDEAPFLVFW